MENNDNITEASIRRLVDDFYARVRRDKDLGPIFDGAIGTDDASWARHLERMYAFWSSVMLSSGRYHGNPMQKHMALPSFDVALFDRWLALFAETARDVHGEQMASHYIDRSRRIAESLKLGLYYRPAGRAEA